MEILVCVKRVPATGGRITLTPDGQEIDTRFLGFTISPHEECAVEEAVRIVEAQGGSSAVLTLGSSAAEEQLRDAMAIGIDRAILLETDGREFDPVATANAIVETVRAQEAAGTPFDLILFGNEAADTGDFQVGIRVAVALDRPIVTGIKGLAVRDGVVAARREAPTGGWETYEIPMPAVVSVKEGLNLPRYPSIPGRLRAKRKEVERIEPTWSSNGPVKVGSAGARGAGRAGRDPRSRPGDRRRRGRPAGQDRGPRLVSGVLVVVEHTNGEPDRLSREALALGASLATATGGDLEAVLVGPGADGVAATLGRTGCANRPRRQRRTARGLRAGGLGGGDRRADGDAFAGRRPCRRQRPRQRGARPRSRRERAVRWPPTSSSVTVGDPWRLTRQRWAGSLLEDADARRRHPSPDRGAARRSGFRDRFGGERAARDDQPAPADGAGGRPRGRVVGHEAPEAGTISLTDARVVIGGGRGVGSSEAFAMLEELAGLLGGAVGGSRVVTSAGWRPHSDQIGQTGLRIAPDLYMACGISGAIQHIVGCKAAKRILAINTDPDAPIMGVADYAVIGDLHQIVPAITAEIRRRAGAPA